MRMSQKVRYLVFGGDKCCREIQSRKRGQRVQGAWDESLNFKCGGWEKLRRRWQLNKMIKQMWIADV